MKFVILSVVCLVGAVIAAPGGPKRKRDILPGDPRYGTDYHHQHHQHHDYHASNEVQTSYGPPNFSSAQSIHQESVQQPSNQYVPAAAASYQAPEHHSVAQDNTYLAPAASTPQQQPANHYVPSVQAAEPIHDSYGAPLVHHHEAPSVQTELVLAPAQPQVHHHVHVQAAQSAPAQHYAAQPAQSHSHVQQSYNPAPHGHHYAQATQPAALYQAQPQQHYNQGFENSGSSSNFHPQAAPQAENHEYVFQQPAQSYRIQIVKAQPIQYQAQQTRPQVYHAPQAHQHVAHHESHEGASSDESSQLVGQNGGYVY